MKFTQPIHIIGAQRTPIGRLGGALQSVNAVELALQAARSTLERAAVSPDTINSVVFGQVLQAGVGMNLARQVGLRLDLPRSTPGYTVNMVCGSGLKAIAMGATEIQNGESSIVLAGGAESMSNAPFLAKDMRGGQKLGNSTLIDSILADGLTDPVLNIGMGEIAERIVDAYGITREEQDAFAAQSHRRACEAQSLFAREIVPIETAKGIVEHDEHPRADSTTEKLSNLKPAFRPDGSVTAGNSSGINDGAAAVLLASEDALHKHSLPSRARIVAVSTVGCEPALMGTGPVGAIRSLCEQTGWNLADVDAVEINEAFAAQTIACARDLKLSPEQLNRRGGAIALGHPIGCSGARVLVALLHIMEDMNLRRGIASLCVGGGMGIAMAIERQLFA